MRCMNCAHLDRFHADSDRLRLVAARFCYVSWCDCQDLLEVKPPKRQHQYQVVDGKHWDQCWCEA